MCSSAALVAHLQRGRARAEVPGEVSGGRWAGGQAAISSLPSTNIVYFCNGLTHSSHHHIK